MSHRTVRRRTLSVVLVLSALVVSGVHVGTVASAAQRKASEAPAGHQRVLRETSTSTVTRVASGRRGAEAFRVKVSGDFPPRALRYLVTVDGEPLGYGIPDPAGTSVVLITREQRVLSGAIAVRYGRTGDTPATVAQDTSEPFLAAVPDPGRTGALEVSAARYNLGDEVFQPTDLRAKVEVAGKVTYPTDLAGGPYPVVVFLHGNHSTCFRWNRADFRWPCREGWKPLPNYAGYNYLADSLASHGYVVVSISGNGVNSLGSRLEDTGMRQRGELIDRHLRLWRRWSSSGSPLFGDRFVGALDMTRIGTMGHSRGGEGVVWHKLVDDERADPFGVDAVLALAPVDFTRVPINGSPFGVILPTCDGDVSDLQGIHFFDDSRYNVPADPAPKHVITMYGANHNFFNEVWSPSSRFPGTMDDGEFSSCFGERMTETRQRRLGRSYIVGFFRRYLADELSIDPMWTGTAIPGFATPEEVSAVYHAPDRPEFRRDLVRFSEANDLAENQLGGALLPERMGLYGWCADTLASPCLDREWRDLDIHRPGLGQAVLGWETSTAEVGMRIPAGKRDVSDYESLQFRAVVPPGYEANGGKFQDLEVALIDENGGEAVVAASSVGNEALAVPNRRFFGHIMMGQVRFPLERFDAIDLTEVRKVEFRFARAEFGTIHVADVAFSSGGAVLPKV
jgi:hypothetical protein